MLPYSLKSSEALCNLENERMSTAVRLDAALMHCTQYNTYSNDSRVVLYRRTRRRPDARWPACRF